MATIQRPHHERPLSSSSTRTNPFHDPQVFVFHGYHDLVYGIDGSRLAWHMLPNMLVHVIEEDGSPEFMDALLKQYEAEQRLRRYIYAEAPAVVEAEVISRMLTRAEKEIELLKRAKSNIVM